MDTVLRRELGLSGTVVRRVKWLPDGILLDGQRVYTSQRVRIGQELSVLVGEAALRSGLTPAPGPLDIVYEDEDLLVVNKAPGVPSHTGPGHYNDTLGNFLMNYYRKQGVFADYHPVHRLDKGTSGLMVVARNGLAQEGLFRDFKARRIRKEYLALCYGQTPALRGSVKYPIDRDPYNRLRMACVEDGREAWTDYERLWSVNDYSLVKCTLHSGRTHQIRVHMQAVRCPLVGDRLYAPSRRSPFGPERIFLHSWKLGFKHPRTGDDMFFTRPLPPELSGFLREIRSPR